MLVLSAVVLAACGVLSQEEQILMDFFQAARLRDTTMAARVSAVDFHPLADGVVEQFDVIRTADDGQGHRIVTLAAVVRRPDGVSENRVLTATLERGAGDRWRLTRLER